MLKALAAAITSDDPFRSSGAARGSRPRRSAAPAKALIGLDSRRANSQARGATHSTDRARISRMRCCQLSKRMAALGSIDGPAAVVLLDGQLEVAEDERLVPRSVDVDRARSASAFRRLLARGRQSLPGGGPPGPLAAPGPARGRPGPSGPASRGGRLLSRVRFWARTKNFGPVSRSISIRAGSTPTSRARAVLNSARRRLSTRPRIGPAWRRITRARPSRGCTVALVFKALAISFSR